MRNTLGIGAIVVMLVASLSLNGYLFMQNNSLSRNNGSLTSEVQALSSQGIVVINGTAFDVTALRLNGDARLADGTVVVFRNFTFSYIPNTSNGTQWLEFSVLPSGSHGMGQRLKAFWWPSDAFVRRLNEAFTSWNGLTTGVMVKSVYPTTVYLLVSLRS